MVVGGLAFGLAALGLVLNLFAAGMAGGRNLRGGNANDPIVQAASGVGSAIFGLCWGGFVLGGAYQMLNLRNYGVAMASAIVAMLPCSGCCLLGLPFGIWALVVLNKQEVREAFQ
jgi:hypothetical protein